MMLTKRLASTCAIPTLLAALLMGCGSASAPGDPDISSGSASATFPAGTYTRCASGIRNGGGSSYANPTGFAEGTSLTVTQSGSTLTATYTDENGDTSSLDFTPTTSASATLARAGDAVSGFWSQCMAAPENATLHPAFLGASAGALTYNDGTVFVTMNGTLQGDPTICGAQPTPASFWLLCDEREGGAPPEPSQATAASAPQSLAGSYSCSSQLGGYSATKGGRSGFAGGGNGTLSVTQDGAELTANYSGDSLVAGALHLTTTTAMTASAEANQSVSVPCLLPSGTGNGSSTLQTPVPFPLTASSLAMVGSTLFVSFSGAVDTSASCPAAVMAGSLICTKP